MAQSLSQIYVHLIFHVKYNSVTILENDLPKLFAYIDGIIVNNKSLVVKIGGVSNHIHILCTLPRTITTAHFVEVIKRFSSLWIKTLDPYYSNFAWQGGYGIFSVGSRQLDIVKRYVENQKQHHQRKSYEKEYVTLLDTEGVEYNKDYLFTD